MKIGIDCHNLEGQRTGVGRYLWNLLKEWHDSRGKAAIIQGESDFPKFFLYFRNEVPRDVYNFVYNCSDSNNCIQSIWCTHVLRGKSNALFKHVLLPRAAASDSVDVLFCPDYVLPLPLTLLRTFPGSLLKIFAKVRRSSYFCIKMAVTIHDIVYEARPQEYSWPSWADKILLKWASKQSAKAADIVFVPSEFTKDEVLKYYKVNSEKVVVTPLAPDPVFTRLSLSEANRNCPIPSHCDRNQMVWWKLEKKYGMGYKKYIFFVGSIFNRRFLPQKIQGFTMFAKDHAEFQFLIIGKNHKKPYQDIGALVAKVNQELGRGAVVWHEYASDEELVYLYNGAFALLWLSSYEGFGLPVLESMACGTPVITCRAGSLPEVAGDAALYIGNPESPEEIAAVLNSLVGDNALANDRVSKGLAHATEFSWQKCAQTTLNNIQKLI